MALTAAEQYLLELMNRARLDPAAESARLGIDLNAGLTPGRVSTESRQVLTANALLEAAATSHSQWILNNDVLTHTWTDGTTAMARVRAAGYVPTTLAEHLALVGMSGATLTEGVIDQLYAAIFGDGAQRLSLTANSLREIGISVEPGKYTQTGHVYDAAVMTLDYASAGQTKTLTGVTYADTDGDGFYSMGEGQGGIRFQTAAGQALTSDAGGYALATGGETALAVTGQAGATAFSLTVDMSRGNVKLDLVGGTKFLSSGSVVLGNGVNNVALLGQDGLSAVGNLASNELTGNSGANMLRGNSGGDTLIGNAGNDTISGESGFDQITGGSGADSLTGGLGADRFIFGDGCGEDRISDFSIAAGDRLVLDDALWGGGFGTVGVVANFASKAKGEVVLDFGGGDIIHLTGLTALSGLGGAILIV